MKLKHWINYRMEELEEKAGVTELPTHDMDGSRFVADDDFEDDARDDAYYHSVSRRMDAVSMASMWYEDEDGNDERFFVDHSGDNESKYCK